MSAPAKDAPEEKKKGVSKFLTRVKTVLKRGDGSKRLSFSGKSAVAGPSAGKATVATPVVEEPAPVEAPVVGDGSTKVLRSQIDSERAKKLAERFKVSLEPLSAGPEKQVNRVEKPIRMRIHRSCHLCGTTYGSNKVCAKCEHVRCKSCPRYPVRKTGVKSKGKETDVPVAPGAIEADTYYGLKEEIILTRPNPKAGGQPLVFKKPHQRVRRTCHECATLFPNGTKICPGCQHVRCADCPRDPARKKKYPDGYPGDAPSSDTSKPVKYTCHKCNKVFPPVPHPDTPEGKAFRAGDPLPCVRCQHPLCGDCPRAPPQKVEPTPDPDVYKSVQSKLAALKISAPVVPA